MKHIKFLIPVFVLLGIYSCKKTNNNATITTSVKATVFDENTQQYVPNQKLTLYEVQNQNSGGGHLQILKEVNTDANGQADFGAFEARVSNDYYYVVTIYSGINYSVPANVIKGQSNTIPFTEEAQANLAVKFMPPPPYNTGDSLSVSFVSKNHQYLIPFKITNSNYSQLSMVRLLSGYYYINIDKYKSGIYTNTKDTVFYIANSTNEYDVNW